MSELKAQRAIAQARQCKASGDTDSAVQLLRQFDPERKMPLALARAIVQAL